MKAKEERKSLIRKKKKRVRERLDGNQRLHQS
jgi:hypothetical protein